MKKIALLTLAGVALASPFALTGQASVGSLEKSARQDQCSGCKGGDKSKDKTKETTEAKPKA
jgi:hypothetical protein